MTYADYIKAESEALLNVFSNEEVDLGDLPAEEKKDGGANTRDAAKAARLAKRQGGGKKEAKEEGEDISKHLYGDRELNRSQGDPELRHTKKFTEVENVTEALAGQEVIVRARLHRTRGKGQVTFFVLRHQFSTIQGVLAVSATVSKAMVGFASAVAKESIVEVNATVTVPESAVEGCSQKVELQVNQFWVIDRSVPQLPFQIDDAGTLVLDQAAEGIGGGAPKEGEKEEEKAGEGATKTTMVYQDTRLNNRIIDLRVPTNQAIFRIQAGVCKLFREFMDERGFLEIHSPKMIGGASEGGANIFKFQYFGRPACLAQSPQLYKQMALMADFDRVFEVGPVFRAEDSNTNRHLCEFTGLDMEMTIKEHYFEVLDVLGDLLHYWCEGLRTRYAAELAVVKAQYPFEDFVCKYPVVKLHFKEGVQMLREAGEEQADLEDLSSRAEKELGRLVKEKYQTDFYMLYGYPAAARPFYTMLDPEDPNYTNSYDFFMRGEEITSGAQRIHDVEMLKERATHFGIPHDTLNDYINSFKYGAPAHGGAGFGLERIVKFYCNLHNIRKSSLFPRDPKRIQP
jgi:aspartyl-tRNA synthetase